MARFAGGVRPWFGFALCVKFNRFLTAFLWLLFSALSASAAVSLSIDCLGLIRERIVARKVKGSMDGVELLLTLLFLGLCLPFWLLYRLWCWYMDRRRARAVAPLHTPDKSERSAGWQQALAAKPAPVYEQRFLLTGSRVNAAFDAAFLAMLHSRPDPEREKQENLRLRQLGLHEHAEVYRAGQILRDCIYHVLHSKKKAVIEANWRGVVEQELVIEARSRVLAPATWLSVQQWIADAQQRAQTQVYINMAKGLEGRAEKLKTNKARLKYWQEAVQVLRDGLSTGMGDERELQQHVVRLEGMINNPPPPIRFKPYADQLQRALENKSTHPYLQLLKGPSLEPCTVHGAHENMLLPVEDDYWRYFPMREAEDCLCHVRSLTRRSYERAIADGAYLGLGYQHST